MNWTVRNWQEFNKIDGDLISTGEMVRRTGLSHRQIDHWVRRGYIAPEHPAEGTGESHFWEPWQVGQIIEHAERVKPHG